MGSRLIDRTIRYYSKRSTRRTSKLQAILRPFVFSVHPDLFGQYPGPKSINEVSLKQLNEYVQASETDRRGMSKRFLKFYQRVDQNVDSHNYGGLRLMKVKLNEDLLQSVRSLLAEGHLPLEDIDNYIEDWKLDSPSADNSRPIDWIQSHYFAATGRQCPFTDVWEEIYKLKPAVSLHRWVSCNIKNAKRLDESSLALRRKCGALQEHLVNKYSLGSITWTCGWRGSHQLASLRKLDSLLDQQPDYAAIVSGRSITMGNESGVSMNGDIALCIDEVPEQWSEKLSTTASNDSYLQKIPEAEQQLSSLLNDIQIVRRIEPPVPMADIYYSSLASLVSRFGMARMMSSATPSKSLGHIKLCVTGTAGDEMTLTPEGHISVPSHSPVWAVRSFIQDNERAAFEMAELYMKQKIKADKLANAVIEDYMLESLCVDNSVSYDKVIECCENLLSSSDSVRHMLQGVRLCIAPYFAVMSDGEMCITWDWERHSH
ncbi:T-cell activation inhibitor, mitochondrial-like isoform X2 [Watersipora subatra]|uniref:T-cell activation inhibitor, mitochondrial-like isoform X2 n=1 Tax=Watersipora subatra TaxID=2589382 RepID=UPI00355AF7D4